MSLFDYYDIVIDSDRCKREGGVIYAPIKDKHPYQSKTVGWAALNQIDERQYRLLARSTSLVKVKEMARERLKELGQEEILENAPGDEEQHSV